MRVVALRAVVVSLAVVLLTACGQTGALYFDEAPPADQLPPSLKQGKPAALPVPVENTEPADKKSRE